MEKKMETTIRMAIWGLGFRTLFRCSIELPTGPLRLSSHKMNRNRIIITIIILIMIIVIVNSSRNITENDDNHTSSSNKNFNNENKKRNKCSTNRLIRLVKMPDIRIASHLRPESCWSLSEAACC